MFVLITFWLNGIDYFIALDGVCRFPPRKIWSQEVLIEHLTIKNLGTVPCNMFVRRIDDYHPTCSSKYRYDFWCRLYVTVVGQMSGTLWLDYEEIYEEDFEDVDQVKVDSVFCIFPSIKFLSLKDKKKEPVKKWRAAKFVELGEAANESQDIAEMIVHSLFKKVFESFTMNRKYEVEIPGRSRVRVSLAFKPRFSPHVGLVHEQWCLLFTDFSEFCHTQVRAYAKTVSLNAFLTSISHFGRKLSR